MIQKIHSNIHDSERLTKSQRDCLWSLRLKGEEQCPGLWNLFCFVSVLTHNDQIYSKDICHKNQYIMCQRILIHNFSNLCVWDLGNNHFERQLRFPFCSPPLPCLQPTPPLPAAHPSPFCSPPSPCLQPTLPFLQPASLLLSVAHIRTFICRRHVPRWKCWFSSYRVEVPVHEI